MRIPTTCLALVLAAAGLAVPAARAEEPADPVASDPVASDTGTSGTIDAKDLAKKLASKEQPECLAAATLAKDVQDRKLVTPLVKLLRDDSYSVRKAAREALSARSADADKKKAAQGLARELPRLSKDEAASDELIETADALHDLAQPVSIDALLDVIKHDTDNSIAAPVLRAVANVPAKRAIEKLIQFAAARGRKSSGHGRAVRDALRYATGESIRTDPDLWRAWWKENERTFDFEAASSRRTATRAEADEREKRREEIGRDGEGRRRRPPGAR